MSAGGALVPLHPGNRYDYLRHLLDGFGELLRHGQLSFPEPGTVVPINIEFFESNHRYKIDGEWVVAVSTVLDDTEVKDALTWWGFRIGMGAIVELLQLSDVSTAELLTTRWKPVVKPAEADGEPEVGRYGKQSKLKSHLEWKAQQRRLDPMSVMKAKGTIGTSMHVAAETLTDSGEIPDVMDFPEDDRGFLQGLARYWIDQEPEVLMKEVIVGSKRFGYAGRFDKIVRTPNGQIRMRDYKTSGGVYSSFDRQLSLYDLAYREMAGEPLDGHDIVHLRPDGTYEVIPVTVDHQDALAALLKRAADKDLYSRIKKLGRTP